MDLPYAGATSDELEWAYFAFMKTAKEYGCPADQVARFLKAKLIMTPKQCELASASRQCDREDGPTAILFGGARGGAKTHGTLALVGIDDCQRHPGLKVLFLRNVGQSARQSFEDLLPKTIGRVGKYRPGHSDFILPNGSWIKIGHFQRESDIDQYIGLEYDVIVKEEANMITPSKHVVLDSCLRSPVGSGWRARQYNTCNPGGPSHTYLKNKYVTPYFSMQESDTRYIHATVDDNPFVTKEYREFLSKLVGWQLQAWRYGNWDFAAGQFFTNFRMDVHVPSPAIEAPEYTEYWGSFDYGFTHYTVFHLFCRGRGESIYLMDEYGRRKADIATNAAAIHRLLETHGLRFSDLVTCDAGADVFNYRESGTTIAQQYEAHGIFLTRGETDRIAGASAIVNRLGDPDEGSVCAPTFFIHPRCRGFIETIQRLEHDDTEPQRPKKYNEINERGEGGDDFYDSARYGVMAGIGHQVVVSSEPLLGMWRG